MWASVSTGGGVAGFIGWHLGKGKGYYEGYSAGHAEGLSKSAKKELEKELAEYRQYLASKATGGSKAAQERLPHGAPHHLCTMDVCGRSGPTVNYVPEH